MLSIMKKSVFTLLLYLLSIGFLEAQTIVKNNITTSTTWSLAGSPYIIDTNYVDVDSGIVLTIDQGVEVKFNGHGYIRVYGALNALGTASDSIHIVGAYNTTGTSKSTYIWVYGKAEFAYTDFTCMSHGVWSLSDSRYPPSELTVKHCYFHDNRIALRGWTRSRICPVSVDSSLFERNEAGIYAADNLTVKNSVFKDHVRGLWSVSNSVVEQCQFSQNQYGIISSLPMKVADCDFQDNVNGFSINMGLRGSINHPNEIRDNRFYNNMVSFGLNKNSPVDSIHLPVIFNNEICSDSIDLIVSTNITNPGDFSPLDLSHNCWCKWDSISVMSDVQIIPNMTFSILPLDSTCLPSMVFPGDANHDQVCNNTDLLPLGIHFGQTGPARANASLNWVGQPADDWAGTQANGRNVKHADCDGDSIVNWADTLAINLNYGLTHTSWRPASGGGMRIRFDMPTTSIAPGDTVSIPISLGTIDTMAMGVYGLAFSIQYDMTLVDSASVWVSYANSWLGTKNIDMLTVDKDFYNLEQMDIGMVRNDQVNRTGYGTIADLIVVINDDLAKRLIPFTLSFSNIVAVDSAGEFLEITGVPGEAEIDTDLSTGLQDEALSSLIFYPNPVEDQLFLKHPSYTFETVYLISSIGQKVNVWEGRQKGELTIPIATFSPGIYLLQVEMKEGRKTIKVQIR